MNYILIIAEIISAASIILGVICAFWVWIKRLVAGQQCQLRSDMLHTYYKHQDDNTLRQYEYENFMLMYKAYKALKGNSFIDKIHDEVTKWKVEP